MESLPSLKTRGVGIAAALLMCLLASSQGQQHGEADSDHSEPHIPPEIVVRNPPPFVPPPGRPGGTHLGRSGPFAGAGFGGPAGPEGARMIPPQLLARRLAIVQAARAAAARAAQDNDGTIPPVFDAPTGDKEPNSQGRPIHMVPYDMPVPRPKGIPTRQGGTGRAGIDGVGGLNLMNQQQPPSGGVRTKRDHHQHEGSSKRNARMAYLSAHNLQSEEEDQ